MLQLLDNLLRVNYAKHEHELKDIEYSCCDICNLDVFSFDEIKKDFFSILKIGEQLCSADALYIDTERNTLFLIEMKSFRDTKKEVDIDDIEPKDCIDFVNFHLIEGCVKQKIIDSLLIILGLTGFYDIDKKFYSHVLDKKSFKIKTIFLTDFNYMEYIVAELGTLKQRGIQLSNRLDGTIDLLNCLKFKKIHN